MERKQQKNQSWPDMPNLQKAVETNFPVLSGILIGFIGALFVTVSISDSSFLIEKVKIFPLFFLNLGNCELPFERRTWIMLFCFFAGMSFYGCISHCIWSQLSNYQEDNTINKVKLPKIILEKWEKNRIDHAMIGLNRFNLGVVIMFLPLIFLLPPRLIAIGGYITGIYGIKIIWEYYKKRLGMKKAKGQPLTLDN